MEKEELGSTTKGLSKLVLVHKQKSSNNLTVKTKELTQPSDIKEESKISPDDITPLSGASTGMEFDGSSKKSSKRSPVIKMSAYCVMEGKT